MDWDLCLAVSRTYRFCLSYTEQIPVWSVLYWLCYKIWSLQSCKNIKYRYSLKLFFCFVSVLLTQKVAGSIPDGVSGIFYWHNPSGRTMTLGLTQPLTEMSTRNISWGGKGGRCVGLTTLPHSCADCLEIWEPYLPGTLWACPGL